MRWFCYKIWQLLQNVTFIKKCICTSIFTNTAQKMKFSSKDFSSKCDQIRSFLRIWSHLLEKSLTETSLFVQWYLEISENFHIDYKWHNFVSVCLFQLANYESYSQAGLYIYLFSFPSLYDSIQPQSFDDFAPWCSKQSRPKSEVPRYLGKCTFNNQP